MCATSAYLIIDLLLKELEFQNQLIYDQVRSDFT